MGEETSRDLAASRADGSATVSQVVKIKAVGQLICSAIRSIEVHLANGSVVAVESSIVEVGIFPLEVQGSSSQSKIDHDRSQQNPGDNRNSKLCIPVLDSMIMKSDMVCSCCREINGSRIPLRLQIHRSRWSLHASHVLALLCSRRFQPKLPM